MVRHRAPIASNAMKNWLLAIPTVVVSILGLAYVKRVDTSREALRVMVETREALQHCEATKRKAALEAPAPTFQNGARRMITLDAPAPTFRGYAQHMITDDARPHNFALGATGLRHREVAKRGCGLEAEQLGRSAALWCARL
jgi:hypothetical protein